MEGEALLIFILKWEIRFVRMLMRTIQERGSSDAGRAGRLPEKKREWGLK